ncbi:pectinesterase 2-like [Neltuma alba]|uniref:pectinesterase 2-like n=1 Tax=Neltuma alba TaxID=207710 RepID=UPI0010A48B21|nr:pectinesterase 2-like [Prosopis alba]
MDKSLTHGAAVEASGRRFLARDITFENTAGHAKHQVVAVQVGADFTVFYQCAFLPHQLSSRSTATVSSSSTASLPAPFTSSLATPLPYSKTARRTWSSHRDGLTQNQKTGIVIQKCRIGAMKNLEWYCLAAKYESGGNT